MNYSYSCVWLSLAALFLFSVSCSEQSYAPMLPSGPSLAISVENLKDDSTKRLHAVLQGHGGETNVFEHYDSNANVKWGKNWTRRFNFNGIAWNNVKTATLVSPRHVVMAAHFHQPAGSTLSFHTRSGKVVKRTISALERVPGVDVMVGLLNEAVPSSIAYYRVLPPRSDYNQYITGAPLLVTEQKRQVYIHRVGAIHGTAASLFKNPNVSEAFYKNLIVGDSGNPSFIIVGGEPVLFETHTTGGGGGGPFYSSPKVFNGVNAAMRALGGGHQLSIVPLS